MTLYKFNKLTYAQQLLMLELHGAQLEFRILDHYHITLFQIGSFYVEAFYTGEKKEAEKLYAFTGTSKLKPYLDNIDISMLLMDIM